MGTAATRRSLDHRPAWPLDRPTRVDAWSVSSHLRSLVLTGNTVTIISRGWETVLTVVNSPSEIGYECIFGCDSGTGDEGMYPTGYVFTKNDGPNIQNSRSWELTTNLRTSFDLDPQDEGAWDEERTSSEEKDGPCLHSYEQ